MFQYRIGSFSIWLYDFSFIILIIIFIVIKYRICRIELNWTEYPIKTCDNLLSLKLDENFGNDF